MLRQRTPGRRAPTSRPPAGTPARLAVGLALTQFVLLTAYSVRFHEMWRDEAQAWLIARDNDLPGLFGTLRYEGHPGLWHLLLYAPAHLGAPMWSMQVLHAGVAAATTLIVARYAPFPAAAKVLFPIGYFAAYEYGVIARNYGIGLLVLMAFCALITAARVRWPAVAATLLLLPQTSVPAAVLLPALLSYSLRAVWARSEGTGLLVRRGAGLTCCAGAGIVLMWAQVRPVPDTVRLGTGTGTVLGIAQMVHAALFPLPRQGTAFWESRSGTPGSAGLLALLLAAGIGTVVLLARRPAVAGAYALGFVALAVFFHEVYAGSLRHHGFFLVLLLVCLWLYLAPDETLRPPARPVRRRAARTLLLGLLAVQAAGGMLALRADLEVTFSNARGAAAVLSQETYRDAVLLLDGDYQTSPILGYLGREGIHTNTGPGSFIRWSTGRYARPGAAEVAALAEEHRLRSGRPVVVVSAGALDDPRLRLVAEAAGPATAWEESFRIYVLAQQ